MERAPIRRRNMSYKVIPLDKIATVTREKILEEDISRHYEIRQADKDEIDLTELISLSSEVSQELELFKSTGEDKDRFEGEIAQKLHETLEKIPIEILDDPGFWAYLTFNFFWGFVYWRQREQFDAFIDDGKDGYRNYVSGTNPSRCVVLRTFLRGKLTYEATGSYELSKWSDLERSAGSFWTDEIVARGNWQLPNMLSKILEKFATDKEFSVGSEGPIRAFSLMLGRRRSSLLLHSLTDKETEKLFTDLLEET